MHTHTLSLEKTTEQLLQRFECVILPGFGGFIVRDSPCNFNAGKDQLKPFARHVFFNPHLHQNDGLLVSEIQKTMRADYAEALHFCTKAIEELKSEVEQNGSRSFGILGTFHKGQEHIWFAPAPSLNLAADSYGLQAVKAEILRKEENTVVAVPPLRTTALSADRSPVESLTLPRRGIRPWLIAASLALLVHFVYLGLETPGVQYQQASALPTVHISAENPLSAPADSSTAPSVGTTDTSVVETANEAVDQPETVFVPEPETETAIPSAEMPASKSTVTEPAADIPLPSAEPVRLARYRLGKNADFHVSDLRRQGKEARAEFRDGWYEVLLTDSVQ